MLVIFDCDGVLVDLEALACQVDADLLTELGIPYTRDEIIRQFVGVSLKDMITRIERDRGCTLPADFGETLNRTLYARFESELQPIPGVREAILALPHRRCVASSSLPERIAFSLRLTGSRRLVRAHLQRQRSRAGQACAGFVPACCRAHGNASRADASSSRIR